MANSVEITTEAELKLKRLADSGRISLEIIKKFASEVRLHDSVNTTMYQVALTSHM